MAFVTEADYKKQIKEDVLEQIIEEDDSIRLSAEDAAQSEMESYLNQRYDVANIFNKMGAARNALVMLYYIDIVLYHIHSRINPHMIPDLRTKRYEQAIQWLRDVGTGKIAPNLPRKVDEEGQPETGSRFGSNIKLSDTW